MVPKRRRCGLSQDKTSHRGWAITREPRGPARRDVRQASPRSFDQAASLDAGVDIDTPDDDGPPSVIMLILPLS